MAESIELGDCNDVGDEAGGREMGSYYFMDIEFIDIEFQFYKMKRILEMDGGNGCTTLLMYLIHTELYT